MITGHIAKNAKIIARINADVKHDAEAILNRLGISMSEAINALFSQIRLTRSFPLQLKIPNEETVRAIEETEAGVGIIDCKDTDDLFEILGMTDAKEKAQKQLSKGSKARTKKR